MIYHRIHPRIENTFIEYQLGARRGKGTNDALFIIRSIINYFKYMNMKLLLEFLDLVKAFDKMDLKGVMLDVWKCNVKGKIWRNIYEINKKANIQCIQIPLIKQDRQILR